MNQNLITFLDFKYELVEKFAIERNGIQIIEMDNKIEIYNDVFRTIPLFITKEDNKIIIFSNYINFYNLKHKLNIDKIGFWETILFGFALGTRTLYQNIKQMTSASKIIINKKDMSYTIERYWDFQVDEDHSIKDENSAAKGLYSILNKNFAKIENDKKYFTGISGGMDSRITLAFLTNHIKKENLNLFTFGFSDKIYEYKYAKEISKKLNLHKPEFHKLDKLTYYNSIKFMPYFTGGQISINHSPLYSYLDKLEPNKEILIATSYSEIIFSLKTEEKKSEKILSFENKVNNCEQIDDKIKKNILDDLNLIKDNYSKTNCFSSIDDYLYLTEQHPKFHEYLTFLFKEKVEVFNPYTDFELLKYVISIPKQFKYRKKLQDNILNNNFNLMDKNVSSSRFEWGDAGGKLEWIQFKLINRINIILRIITRGRIEILNPYQTEEQSRLMYAYFQKIVNKELLSFYKKDLISEKNFKFFEKLPLKSQDVIERYHLLSLGEIIND